MAENVPRGCGSGGAVDEASPLLQRRSSRLQDRHQYRVAQRDAAQRAVFSRETLWSLSGLFIVLLVLPVMCLFPLLLILIEVKSWYVLVVAWGTPCDQPLVWWLLARNLQAVFSPRMPSPYDEIEPEEMEHRRFKARLGAYLALVWLMFGYVLIISSKTCRTTSPLLFEWVRFLVFFGMALVIITTALPMLFMLGSMAYHAMVSRGWIRSPNAAREETIEQLKKVKYSPDLFTEADNACCCCLEEYGPEKAIVETPCGHFYHYDCIKEWLRLENTCPLCRCDLDAAIEAATEAANMEAGYALEREKVRADKDQEVIV